MSQSRSGEAICPCVDASQMIVLVKLLKLSRGHERMSFLVEMLREICVDMGPFVLIIAISLVFSTSAFMVLTVDEEESEYSSFFEGMLHTFSQMLLAVFATPRFANSVGLAFLFVISEFFINIVMLNALIAIMVRRTCFTRTRRACVALALRFK